MVTSENRGAGRPRSERARTAILHAVDDLLVEVGYADMTMKGIAERAGVGRQTVYRWWSTKAEVLFEASIYDARSELAIEPGAEALDMLTAYITGLVDFLTRSPAGLAYRALVGEAQHDPAVADLLRSSDVLCDSANAVLRMVLPGSDGRQTVGDAGATALLIGPVFFWILSGRDPAMLKPRELASAFLTQLGANPRVRSSDRPRVAE